MVYPKYRIGEQVIIESYYVGMKSYRLEIIEGAKFLCLPLNSSGDWSYTFRDQRIPSVSESNIISLRFSDMYPFKGVFSE